MTLQGKNLFTGIGNDLIGCRAFVKNGAGQVVKFVGVRAILRSGSRAEDYQYTSFQVTEHDNEIVLPEDQARYDLMLDTGKTSISAEHYNVGLEVYCTDLAGVSKHLVSLD